MDTFDYINDPINKAQVATLRQLLGEEWTDRARDGFLVLSGRLVDETSTDRTEELGSLFGTDSRPGRKSLRNSLEALIGFVGSLKKFEADYTVYINDPVRGSIGLFPQFPMIGIHTVHPALYRLFHSNARVYGSSPPETVQDYIVRTRKLPMMKPPDGLILRKKPRMYWCSSQKYGSPLESRAALQILEGSKSDCRMRATLPSAFLEGSVFVAYSGVTEYPDHEINLSKDGDVFAGYNLEVKASDHPELPGGGLQVGVVGEPVLSQLEEWRDDVKAWVTVWPEPAGSLSHDSKS